MLKWFVQFPGTNPGFTPQVHRQAWPTFLPARNRFLATAIRVLTVGLVVPVLATERSSRS